MSKQRLIALDALRGLALVQMILYHALWDGVFLFGWNIPLFHTNAAFVWQQVICCTFILLSGFCLFFSRRPVRHGLVVFGWGGVLSLVTLLIMPENRVLFGVLTLLGSCMVLVGLTARWLKNLPSLPCAIVCFILFCFTRNSAAGSWGLGAFSLSLPASWYKSWISTYLGFPMAGFFSTDYFPLIPWLFLFCLGFFLHGICQQKPALLRIFQQFPEPILPWIGQHSLVIYLLHQPVIYLTVWGISSLFAT